ncbi:hypothetical protein M2D07_015280 [Pseudomonas sp. BGr12]|uniref:hypothetical protein n=1 Tax=Pseudomonas sp. BGr12 TaxID=2936269 RepID=UPI0025595F1A|nr:hypothetical protein [Pseudomonas sp. BJa5]MDL2428379.1 hypothetical protein [Pseudomonas sp. BJa5]
MSPINLEQLRKKPEAAESIPDWVTSETKSTLYEAIISMYIKIESDILNNKPKNLKDRKIVARKIALQCNLSPSIITPRRQPEVVDLISDLNQRLDELYISVIAKSSFSGRKLSRAELLEENRTLKLEVAELRSLSLGAYATSILESSLPEKSRLAALTIAKLREEISRQEIIIENQAEQNRNYMEALNRLKPSQASDIS